MQRHKTINTTTILITVLIYLKGIFIIHACIFPTSDRQHHKDINMISEFLLLNFTILFLNLLASVKHSYYVCMIILIRSLNLILHDFFYFERTLITNVTFSCLIFLLTFIRLIQSYNRFSSIELFVLMHKTLEYKYYTDTFNVARKIVFVDFITNCLSIYPIPTKNAFDYKYVATTVMLFLLSLNFNLQKKKKNLLISKILLILALILLIVEVFLVVYSFCFIPIK